MGYDLRSSVTSENLEVNDYRPGNGESFLPIGEELKLHRKSRRYRKLVQYNIVKEIDSQIFRGLTCRSSGKEQNVLFV